LIGVLDSPSDIEQLERYATTKLITRLQQTPSTDQNLLFRIEWNFLPWLDRFSSGRPKLLQRKLASDPAFFAELVGLIFRSRKEEKPESNPTPQRKNLAKNAYALLTDWKLCPGIKDDGSFDVQEFNTWINEARRITEETGHAEVAQIQIGHVLTYAPADPDGLWIHEAVASTLNYRDTGEMRSGFTTELFNRRGVHGFTHGREERELANRNREKAEALETKGYTRFATAMREFAERYDRQAEHEAKRNPFEDD
jgi:hypothetical protein